LEKVALVTGASSGIGFAVGAQLEAAGYLVFGLSRRGTAPEGVVPLTADVTKEEEIHAAVEVLIREAGQIDLLVNNAGYGISGSVEFTDSADAHRQFEVNFFGQLAVAKAVLPFMRKQGGGRILFVSSVAAEMAIPYQAFYSASKAAVSSLALSLRNEVSSFGISVGALLPGDASTGFTDARQKTRAGDEIYSHGQRAVAAMEKDERNGMTSDEVAAAILRAAVRKRLPPVLVVGGKYRVFHILFRLLPIGLAYRIIGRMYA